MGVLMVQSIDKTVWELYEKAIAEEPKKKEGENRIQNSGTQSTGEWVRKVVDKISISDIAERKGVTSCPDCGYDLNFDDSRGFFICVKAKYNKTCGFQGNIVDFVARVGGID